MVPTFQADCRVSTVLGELPPETEPDPGPPHLPSAPQQLGVHSRRVEPAASATAQLCTGSPAATEAAGHVTPCEVDTETDLAVAFHEEFQGLSKNIWIHADIWTQPENKLDFPNKQMWMQLISPNHVINASIGVGSWDPQVSVRDAQRGCGYDLLRDERTFSCSPGVSTTDSHQGKTEVGTGCLCPLCWEAPRRLPLRVSHSALHVPEATPELQECPERQGHSDGREHGRLTGLLGPSPAVAVGGASRSEVGPHVQLTARPAVGVRGQAPACLWDLGLNMAIGRTTGSRCHQRREARLRNQCRQVGPEW
ncbi:hypothetical protein P7K49_000032 [Saguinus oedipus]|uniref:Uncharacterized protein n=1 Tax=Saguinus oedipus TaxID=9490 RepID=A0ABQ9WAJ7_SAGOE|nr:hypothetical protein P7K49_000032 [Saguinus oedipus]